MAHDLKRKRPLHPLLPAKRVHRSPQKEDVSEHSGSERSDSPSRSSSPEPNRPQDSSHSHHAVRPPTGEELRNIKDATELYCSSSFKLQIDALLPRVTPKYQSASALESFLLALHKLLAAIPSHPPQHPLHAARSFADRAVAVPYVRPAPSEDTNWKVAFEPPAEIILAGSWATKTAVKAIDSIPHQVDVAVSMPSSLFQEKDYLNGRVFQKRAFYLAVIASAIANAKDLPCDQFYHSPSGDPRSGKEFDKLNVQICIEPFLADSPIPLQRLSPARSNVRTGSHDESSSEEPTPIYNTAFMLMTTPKAHLLSIHSLKQDVPGFGDALTLLRIWANQRGYGPGKRMCVRGFEKRGMWWASLLAMLVRGEEPRPGMVKASSKRKPLGKGLSSYQLFKASLDFLARHNFANDPVFVKSKDGHRFPPDAYSSHDATFVDSTSSVNLLAGVPLSSLDMLKNDAETTLAVLNQVNDPFDAVFLKDHRDAFSRFDIVLQLDMSSAEMRQPSAHLVADHGSVYNALMASMMSTLRRALGDRAKAVAVLHPTSAERPLTQALPVSPSVIHVGLILDPEHAFRLVDHGPSAEEQETAVAKAFRELWGEKAELRRFKDGRIVESVVWEVKNADERAHIPTLIAVHILKRHFGISSECIRTWQAEFDGLVKAPESIKSLYDARGGVSTGFKAALAAFDGLVKSIKALDEELPLSVLNASPICAALRHTEVFVPVAIPLKAREGLPPAASYLPTMDFVLEFEKSGRWPDDLQAIQKIKLAFFERLAASLAASVKGIHAAVAVQDSPNVRPIEDQAALDIITPDGWAFRAHIWHDREETLLSRVINDQPHVPKALRRHTETAHEVQAALAARSTYLRRFVHAPRHHRAVAALAHQLSAFSGTVRLTKRWFAAHWLLRAHVAEEAVELLCAHVFLRHGMPAGEGASVPGVPASKERGFAAVLAFLKDWDWTQGLSVALDYGEGEAAPAGAKVAGKLAAWALSTSFDPDGHAWTARGPSAVVARRVTALARASWDSLRALEAGEGTVKDLFRHPTAHYDAVIELDRTVAPRYYQNVDADTTVWAPRGKYANAPSRNDGGGGGPMPGFDPIAMYCDALTHAYDAAALVFYDAVGGDRVGIVWQPKLKAPLPFRALGGFSGKPVDKTEGKTKESQKALVVLNEQSCLIEMRRLGTGLVV
ncbi:Nrap protein [Epithele typhae]|uniref:Nrap protein n=1 Tax=Epithele typhae TaxID=378194 RepID=UPI002008BE82|nr:Nrap protein [Epithele typhae]KAH9914177.1 Nrap protein [Epithele typhae]